MTECHPAACRDEELWRAELAKKDAEIERLRAALADARDALYNGFEPDNQSRAWHRASKALAHEQS